MNVRLPIYIGLILSLFCAGCSSIPKTAKPVAPFEVDRYLGTWYEVARLDHKFERGLSHVTATYSANEDGSIRVLNKGYNKEEQEWKSAEGKAKFRGEPTVAALKVSFFGPFYSGYNVLAIDKDYQYALVAGKDLDFLWILSRERSIPEEVKLDFLRIALEVGYTIDDLLWVDQDPNTEGAHEG
ncbi:lipocalin family protein [Sphingobacterium sp. lm-10]|uniref:lipocalin family protein n=1 Tax=Sphingobacterium sp. lm-10 TaxID=2944904 RepID=UPI0024C2B959|nr:lipocalin family protein [Sphingobacterium sp. lm-10]